jgi:hypothetical protein
MSTHCTFYDPATGTITQVADLSDETLEHYVTVGAHAILDVRGDPATQYVANDELVSYTPDEAAAKAGLLQGWLWQMPERVAVDARALAILVDHAVAAIDAHADAARNAVVGDGTRVVEYKRAEDGARAFKAAGYAGTAPPSVASWAAAKDWTWQQSADDIIAAADRWYGALDAIRALRLQAKEDIRHAATNAAVDAILATFIATLTAAMQGIQ